MLAQWHTIKPGTPEHGTGEHGTTAEHQNTPEQWRNNWTLPYPEHQQNTPEYQRNTDVTPAEHLGTTESYKTKNNCSIFKRKFKPQNLNFQLKFETFSIADIIYLFIYFSLFKFGFHVVKKFLTNKWWQNKQTNNKVWEAIATFGV